MTRSKPWVIRSFSAGALVDVDTNAASARMEGLDADLTRTSVDNHYWASLWGKILTSVQQLGGVLFQ